MNTHTGSATFFDEEMAALAKTVLAYLRTERGQQVMREMAKASPELNESLKRAHEIPWETLHEPSTGHVPDPQLQDAIEALLWQLNDRGQCTSCFVRRTPTGLTHKPGCKVESLNAILNARVPRSRDARSEARSAAACSSE